MNTGTAEDWLFGRIEDRERRKEGPQVGVIATSVVESDLSGSLAIKCDDNSLVWERCVFRSNEEIVGLVGELVVLSRRIIETKDGRYDRASVYVASDVVYVRRGDRKP